MLIDSSIGIRQENVTTLQKKASWFSPVQRYVVVVMDEMKIQSNLMFDKVSKELSLDLLTLEIQ